VVSTTGSPYLCGVILSDPPNLLSICFAKTTWPKISAYAHVHRQHDYMKRLFAPLGCLVMAHVKPKNRRTWDVHGEVGYSIGTSMEHNRCFNVYIVKTRATRISDSVFFKHQYITNPQITPETLVMKVAAELTSALKGTVSQDAETADALAKVSDLFQKIAASKADRANAKEQRNQHRTHPSSRRAVPIPRVENEPPARQAIPIPRVQATPTVDDCCIVGGGSGLQIVECRTRIRENTGPPARGQITSCKMTTKISRVDTTHGPR
jgi:hypothetical protein